MNYRYRAAFFLTQNVTTRSRGWGDDVMGVRDVCVYFPQLNLIIVREFLSSELLEENVCRMGVPHPNLCE